ncbi:MAG: MATE family efflux transporter [Clostridia bacterium]|nr:MATE family efflux transporter [Clostridia bacterium]
MTEKIKRENTSDKLREMPMGKLILNMSLPAIVSMLVQALYNIVDSLFVARISDLNNNALEAVSIALPLCMVVMSLGIGIGVGTNVYISRKLGEKNHLAANNAAKTAVLMVLAAWVLMIIMGLTLTKTYVAVFTDNPEIAKYAIEYGTIYIVLSLGMLTELTCIRILQATGNMKLPMISQLVGAVTNIILDPILIFGLLGMPALEVKGAAIATVIGQWAAATILVIALLKKNREVNIRMKSFRPRWEYVKNIAKIGLPNFIMNSAMSFTNMAMLGLVKAYEGGIVALTMQNRLQNFAYMPVFGMTQGLVPILSYNYGANNKKRYLDALKKGTAAAFIYFAVCLAVFQIFPTQLASLFNPTAAELALAIKVFRIMSLSFIPAAFGIMMICALQSLNLATLSMAASLLRQIGFVLCFGFLFEHLFGIQGVFVCYPTAEILHLAIFIPFAIHYFKKQFNRKQAQYDSGLLSDVEVTDQTPT